MGIVFLKKKVHRYFVILKKILTYMDFFRLKMEYAPAGTRTRVKRSAIF